MEKMWMRSVVTLALCLSVAACGKNKDGGSAPVEAKPPAPTTPATDNNAGGTLKPAVEPENADMKGNKANPEVDRKKPHRAQEKPHGSDNANHENHSGSETSKPKVEEKDDKRAEPATDVFEAMLEDSKKYSGAADDGLRELLTYKQTQLGEAQRTRNAKFARTIQRATLRTDSVTGLKKITLTIGNKEVGFVGRTNQGSKMDLPSNAQGFSGNLTCMDELSDAGQTCETGVAEISYKTATVQIIFRETALTMNADFGDHSCLTPDCDSLYNLFRYSQQKIVQSNTLKQAVMSSSEVIFGKSEFTVTILTNENQIMKISGPLINPFMKPTTDIAADRSLTQADLIDPSTRQIRKTSMNEALNDVRIVTNDGRGRIGLLVKMRMQEDGRADNFQVLLERKVRPITTAVEPIRSARN
jgi:hypothetical protein